MEAVLPRAVKEQFALAAAIRQEDILYREKMARFAARERQITAEQELAAKRSEAEVQAFIEQMLAPPARIEASRTQLDTYDTKTVEALIENQEALDLVRTRLDDMLGQAQILPDGRRVFKTNDGQRVFDERGQEVGPDAIDPAAIDDRKPRWEAFKADMDERVRLDSERQGLINYQDKLDHARERLDRDGLTVKELDEMERGLRDTMPDSVRAKVEPDRPKADGPSAAPAVPDGMDALMRQTGLGPSQMSGPRL